jgi:hypothetical protein
MTKGKIVLVPFPFDDLSAKKVRPALCLTNLIGPHRHVILAFITSQIPPTVTITDVVLDPAQKDFAATGLRVPSVFGCIGLSHCGARLLFVNWASYQWICNTMWIENWPLCSG